MRINLIFYLINIDDNIVMNSRLIVNKGDGAILTELKNLFNPQIYDEFLMMVSYVKHDALKTFMSRMLSLKGGKIIVTTDGHVTSPETLNWLMNTLNKLPNFESRVFLPNKNEGFHIKAYSFENETLTTHFVGSSNISHTAFVKNYELNTVNEYSTDSEQPKVFVETFQYFWEKSSLMTNSQISEYELEFNNAQVERYLEKTKSTVDNPMQQIALKEIKNLRSHGKDRAIQIAATGSGKTRLSVDDILNFIQENKSEKRLNILFLTINEQLISQTLKTFSSRIIENGDKLKISEFSIEHCSKLSQIINQNEKYNITLMTHKGSIKTIFENDQTNEKLGPEYFDYILIDECHHLNEEINEDETIETHVKKVSNYFSPKFMLGLTATPDRTNKYNLVTNVFKKNIVDEYTIDRAINDNVISRFLYYVISKDEFESFKDTFVNDFVKHFESQHVKVVEKIIDKYGFDGKKLKAIAFINGTENCKRISELFNIHSTKYKATYLTGTHSTEERIDTLSKLASDGDKLNIVFSDGILTEGVDIPEINTILILRKTSSFIRYMQQIGRGLRINPQRPDSYLTVFDFASSITNDFSYIFEYFSKESIQKGLIKEVVNGFGEHQIVMDGLTQDQALDIIKNNQGSFALKSKIDLFSKELQTRSEEFGLVKSKNPKEKEQFVSGYLTPRELDKLNKSITFKDYINSNYWYTKMFQEIGSKLSPFEIFSFEMLCQAIIGFSNKNDINKFVNLINGKWVNKFDSYYVNALLDIERVNSANGEIKQFYWKELRSMTTEIGEVINEESAKEYQSKILLKVNDMFQLNDMLMKSDFFRTLLSELDLFINSKLNTNTENELIMNKIAGKTFRFYQIASFYKLLPMSFVGIAQRNVGPLREFVQPKVPSAELFANEVSEDGKRFKYFLMESHSKNNERVSELRKSVFEIFISLGKSKFTSEQSMPMYLGNAKFIEEATQYHKQTGKDLKYFILEFDTPLSKDILEEIKLHKIV